jgi:DNA (cytosine-5)-methyltransferase 1
MEKKICELFAGVGGFRLGFDRLNSGWETVWFSQWEPGKKAQWAHDCYVKHFGDCQDINGEYHTDEDISTIDKSTIPDHTLLVGGFPCQDYSVAHTLATSKGIEGKKGVLWWQIRDIIEAKKPPFCLFENVDRLLKSPATQRGRDFGIILSCLHSLGYNAEWRVVNAANFGAPQRRKRVFIFAYRRGTNYDKEIRTWSPIFVIRLSGFMARVFPESNGNGYMKTTIDTDLANVSDNFSCSEFYNAGYMVDGQISSQNVEDRIEPYIPLGEILQQDVDQKYYVQDEDIAKWEYLKSAKKNRTHSSQRASVYLLRRLYDIPGLIEETLANHVDQ